MVRQIALDAPTWVIAPALVFALDRISLPVKTATSGEVLIAELGWDAFPLKPIPRTLELSAALFASFADLLVWADDILVYEVDPGTGPAASASGATYLDFYFANPGLNAIASGPATVALLSKSNENIGGSKAQIDNPSVSVVPESATLALLVVGLGLGGFSMRRRSETDGALSPA